MKKSTKKELEKEVEAELMPTNAIQNMFVLRDEYVPQLSSETEVTTYPMLCNETLPGELISMVSKIETQAKGIIDNLSKEKESRVEPTEKAKQAYTVHATLLQEKELALLKAQNEYLEQKVKFKEIESAYENWLFKDMLSNEKSSAVSGQLTQLKYGVRQGFLSAKYDMSRVKDMKQPDGSDVITFTYTEPIVAKEN